MSEVLQHINYLHVLLGGVLAYVLGALWYSPVLFGNAWLAAIGKQQSELNMTVKTYVATAVWWLFASFLFAILINFAQADNNLPKLIVLVVVAWGAFGKTPLVMDKLYREENTRLLAINGGYHFCAFLLMALVHAFI